MPFPLLFAMALVLATPAFAQDSAVTAKPFAEVAVYPQREASGQAVALNESRMASEISARIEEIPVEVGQTVPRGAIVAKLDCRDNQLALERARAARNAARSRLQLAEHQLRRARELSEKGFFSKEAVETRSTEVEVLRADAAQAQAQSDTAERAVGKCLVRSPFQAIVRQRLGQVGELATPGTPLVALVDAARVEVSAQVQPKDAPSLRQAKEIRFVAGDGSRAVRLLRVSPAIDAQARTVEARLVFAAGAAAPGSAGHIVWRDSRPHVPAQLLVRRNGRLGIFVDEGGIARFKPIPEAQEGRPAAVELPPGARVIAAGHLGLQEGHRLQ